MGKLTNETHCHECGYFSNAATGHLARHVRIRQKSTEACRKLQRTNIKLFIGLFEASLTKFKGKRKKQHQCFPCGGRTGGIFASLSFLQKFCLPSLSSKLTNHLLLCEESRVLALTLDNLNPSWFFIISFWNLGWVGNHYIGIQPKLRLIECQFWVTYMVLNSQGVHQFICITSVYCTPPMCQLVFEELGKQEQILSLMDS